jgi:hypothetical protein
MLLWFWLSLSIIRHCLFFGFFFGMVQPETDKLNRTKVKTCKTIAVTPGEYHCSKKTGCICSGCDGVPVSCSTRESLINSTGACCDASCCAQYKWRTYSCKKYVCSGCSGNEKCCRRWTTCKEKYCYHQSFTRCQVQWGWCWKPILYFRLIEQEKIRLKQYKCGFQDSGCLIELMVKYPINGTFQCWYDPKHDKVSISAPGAEKVVGGWIGAGFGIAFLALAIICCSFSCFLSYCHCRKKSTNKKKAVEIKHAYQANDPPVVDIYIQPTAPPFEVVPPQIEGITSTSQNYYSTHATAPSYI